MAMPAVKREHRSEHASSPRLRLVRSAPRSAKNTRRAVSSRQKACQAARCRRNFRLACTALVVLAGIGMARVELTVQGRSDGVVSRWFADRARRGDLVRVSGPEGSFCLTDADGPVLMLSGGSGVTPMVAILRALASGVAAGSRDRREVVLVHHATSSEAVLHGPVGATSVASF